MKLYKLKDVATIEISGVDKKFKEDEIPIYLCNFTDVYYNWAITSDIRNNFIAASANKKEIDRFKLRKGQVALTKDSETRYDIGISTYIAEDFKDVILGYHCALITPNKDKINGKYLNAFIHSDYIRKYFENSASGSGQRYSLSVQTLEDMPILLPSIEKQQHIGKILSDIDRKIALNKAINHNLEAMAKQLYDYWFVQFDFPNEDGKPYKSSGGKMVWNEKLKREIPEGWEATTFVSLIKNSRNGDWGKETIIGNYTEKVYCIRGTDINGLKGKERIKLPTRFILKKNNEKYLSENEFVVEISGGSPTQSTGRIILLTRKMFERFDSNIICSNFCKSISLKEKKYIFFFLQEWERLYNNRTLFDYEGKTSGIKNFLFDDFINSYKIILPSKNIVEKFYSYSENIDNKLQESLKEIESLSKQRDELLPLLMNGQARIG